MIWIIAYLYIVGLVPAIAIVARPGYQAKAGVIAEIIITAIWPVTVPICFGIAWHNRRSN